MFVSPGALAVNTPFIKIYWYGICLTLGFIVGQLIVFLVAQKEYSDKNTIDNICEFAFWTLLSGIIGARLYYVLLCYHYYFSNPLEIVMLQHGGLAIHGGLFGGTIGAFLYSRCKKISFLKYADLYALGLPIAQAIGRWGNFFNSEAFGLPANLPWAVFIPISNRPDAYINFSYFHPAFLYESILNIIIFLILFFVIKKHFFKIKGILFFSYMILYSSVRIVVELLRIDSVLKICSLSIAIWICILLIIISAFAICCIYKSYKKTRNYS